MSPVPPKLKVILDAAVGFRGIACCQNKYKHYIAGRYHSNNERDIMNNIQLKAAIIDRLNEQCDLPFLDEAQEGALLSTLVTHALNLIPVSLLPLMLDSTDGLTILEFEKHRGEVVDYINNIVDIPYVVESVEARFISTAITAMLIPLLKGESVE